MGFQADTKVITYFTLPPYSARWPYILINPRSKHALRYISLHRDIIKEIIVDAGVEVFREEGIFEYPEWQLIRQMELYDALKKEFRVWLTIPDFPDDYAPGKLWEGSYRTNIERTIEHIFGYIDAFPDVNFIIPIQANFRQIDTGIRFLEMLDELGFPFKKFFYYGLGTVCVEKKHRYVYHFCKRIHNWLKRRIYFFYLHAFGVRIDVLPKIVRFIDSFDSVAYALVREPQHTPDTKADVFYRYIRRINELVSQVKDIRSGVRYSLR